MTTTQKYRRRSVEVEAMQYDGTNGEAIEKFSGHKMLEGYTGAWFVKSPDRTTAMYVSGTDFTALYEPLPSAPAPGMAECPTCKAASPDNCGLPGEVGCDHPSVLAEARATLEEIIAPSSTPALATREETIRECAKIICAQCALGVPFDPDNPHVHVVHRGEIQHSAFCAQPAGEETK